MAAPSAALLVGDRSAASAAASSERTAFIFENGPPHLEGRRPKAVEGRRDGQRKPWKAVEGAALSFDEGAPHASGPSMPVDGS